MSPSELGSLALDLCRIPSVTGNEAACADFIERWLSRTDLAVERVGESVIARAPARAGVPLVLLVGHTDTVPPKTGDPTPHIDGDRLVGLGASDMKGGLAVMLALAGEPRPTNAPYDVGYVFYDREEGPWANSGLAPVLDGVPWLSGAALAFCLEPSDNVVQVGCMGTLHASVTFRGRAAHSARPWQGENAIHKAAPLLAHLAERPPNDVYCAGHLFREVLSATLAKGGATRNVVPDRFELNLNLRYAPARTPAEAEALLREVCGDAEVEISEHAPAGRVVSDNIHLRRFLAVNGNAIAAKQAWTDVARLTSLGIDAVNLGPGHAAQAHQAAEHASIALIAESHAQFARFFAPSGAAGPLVRTPPS